MRGELYLSLHCHHLTNFSIKMDKDESHVIVSFVCEVQSHKTVSIKQNL